MFYSLAVTCGVLIAVMIAINGGLTTSYGVYTSTWMIHLVGLVFVSILILLRKERFLPEKKLPWYMFMGGAVGVLTTICNNLSFGKISMSALLALGLFGQSFCSLFIDQIGLPGMERQPFRATKIVGLLFVLWGIWVMVNPIDASMVAAIVVSFLAGATIVASRTINAGLADAGTVLQSTFYNYFVGIIVCTPIWLLAAQSEPSLFEVGLQNPLAYTGGLFGVIIICILNFTVSKIPSYYMTLLTFVGQVFAGIAIDCIITQSFSQQNLIGGLLVGTGLCLDMYFDRCNKRKYCK